VRTRDCAGARREGEGSGRRGVQGAESAVGRAETHVVSTPGYSESSECREYPMAPYTQQGSLRRGTPAALQQRSEYLPERIANV
jgi:hypothetical protein